MTSVTRRIPHSRCGDCGLIQKYEAGNEIPFATASYESHVLGAFDLFATDLSRAVVIEVDAPADDPERDVERWVVTPDDADGFLTALGA